ncbi:MAG: antibiotic biosynthesis monooxygenase [Desertifilum sp.]|nr:antibiotic biosynthesis monooxygenase [Desertifilum sp.]
MSDRVIVLILALLLPLIVGTLNPNPAQADKAVKAISFDPASEMVNVATIYETTPTTQKEVVSGILKSSKSITKKAPGFSTLSVLQSQDGTRAIALTQWQDLASFEAFLAQPVEEKEAKKEKEKDKETIAIAPLRTVVFTVAKTQAPQGMVPSLRGKAALVQFDEFTVLEPDDLSTVLDSVTQGLPSITQLYPAPRSAVLLQSPESHDIALLANWGYSMEYDDPSLIPTVDLLPEEMASLTESDRHLYEVVKITAAKPEKEKD